MRTGGVAHRREGWLPLDIQPPQSAKDFDRMSGPVGYLTGIGKTPSLLPRTSCHGRGSGLKKRLRLHLAWVLDPKAGSNPARDLLRAVFGNHRHGSREILSGDSFRVESRKDPEFFGNPAG